mgnify:CR=1 FL=1
MTEKKRTKLAKLIYEQTHKEVNMNLITEIPNDGLSSKILKVYAVRCQNSIIVVVLHNSAKESVYEI